MNHTKNRNMELQAPRVTHFKKAENIAMEIPSSSMMTTISRRSGGGGGGDCNSKKKSVTASTSMDRRESLRKSLSQRAFAFTPSESNFLDLVMEFGSEVEISTIEATLQDKNLFFNPTTTSGRDSDNGVVPPPPTSSPRPTLTRGKSLSSTTGLGSTRRLQVLAQTHQESQSTRTELWKAHEKRSSSVRLSQISTRTGGSGGGSSRQLRSNRSSQGSRSSSLRQSYTSLLSSTINLGSFDLEDYNDDDDDDDDDGSEKAEKSTITQTGSIDDPIPEATDSQEDSEHGEEKEEEKKDESMEENGIDQEEEEVYEPPRRTTSLQARRASRFDYNGQGFELDEEEFVSQEMIAPHGGDDEKQEEHLLGGTSYNDYYEEEKEWEEEYELPLQQPPIKARRASRFDYSGQGFELGDLSEDSYVRSRYSEELVEEVDGNEEDETDALAIQEGGMEAPFLILGTSAEDASCFPHVLSPPLMESLQSYMPFSKRGESYWLRYSLVRDGASTHSFLQNIRGSKYVVLAMETVEGEVFGAFTSQSWHIQHGYFGTGESFVWRLKGGRPRSHSTCTSLDDVAQQERDVEVFKYAHDNKCIQICQSDRVAVGGGMTSIPRQVGLNMIQPNQWGFALAFEDDYMLDVSSAPCITFNSPSLSKLHPDGSKMELINLEAWTLTPCTNLADAEVMEMGKLFLKRHMTV